MVACFLFAVAGGAGGILATKYRNCWTDLQAREHGDLDVRLCTSIALVRRCTH